MRYAHSCLENICGYARCRAKEGCGCRLETLAKPAAGATSMRNIQTFALTMCALGLATASLAEEADSTITQRLQSLFAGGKAGAPTSVPLMIRVHEKVLQGSSGDKVDTARP